MEKKLNLGYTGISSFAKYPICTDLNTLDADVAILGAPYDMATQYRSGAKMGPRGIRDSSTMYGGLKNSYDHEKDEVFLGENWKIVDCGDVDMIHGDLKQSLDNIESAVRKIVERGAIPVVLGGDHSITIPFAKGLEDAGPFSVVQIDAHLDYADERFGQKYGHGSPMRRMSEMTHVGKMAQLGIHGLGSSSKQDFEDARNYGNLILSPRQIREIGINETLKKIPDSNKYFVTIDIDGLDISIAPGTGTPSPGGLYYYEVMDLLEGISKKGEVVGFDLVEVAPAYDFGGATSQLAARIILDFLGFILKEKGKN